MLSIILVSTAFMVYQGTKVQVSFKFSRLLPLSDTTQVEYDQFRSTFNQAGNQVVIAAEDINVFEAENYQQWKALEEALDTITGVTNTLSPISAYNLRRNDSLKKLEPVAFDDYFSAASADSLGKLYHSLPFYKDLLYSRDQHSPLLLVQIDKNQLYNENIVRIIESLKATVASFSESSGYKVHVSGLPYLRMANTKKISKEIGLSVVFALLVTVVLMFLFLRSFKATMYSMLVVLLGVAWSFGLIGSFGYKLSMLSALIPSLIIVIGVPNCIFLINKYHAEYKYHKNKILAVQRVIRKIGAATLMTNTTTALGFAAFILTDSEVLKEFGVIASLNIMMVFVISIIIIPIFYSFSRTPKKRHYVHLDKNWLQGFIAFLTHTVQSQRALVYTITAVLSAIALFGTTKLITTGNLSEEYMESDPLLIDLRFLEQEFGGVVPLEIVIDSKRPNGVQKLSFISKLDRLQQELADLPHLSRSLSVADGVKFAKQAYYRGEPDFYELPTRQEQSFIMSYIPRETGGLNLLQAMVDSSGQKARVSLQVKDLATDDSRALQDSIRQKVDAIFNPERYDSYITGASVVFLKGTKYLIKNLVISLAIAIAVIAVIMSLLFRSIAMVMVSLVTNIFPLLMTAGIMGYFGIPLKPSTILVFSIAFGISVDDTIHFLAKYRQELRVNGWNIADAVLVSIRETGVSMFYTSIVLFFGFITFTSSSFGGIVSLGILVSITLIIAMLSNLILLPTFLMTLAKWAANKDFDHPVITLYDNSELEEEEDTPEEGDDTPETEKTYKP